MLFSAYQSLAMTTSTFGFEKLYSALLNYSKLIVYQSKWFPWSSRINFIPFKIFIGPLFHKTVTGQKLFLLFLTAKRHYTYTPILYKRYYLFYYFSLIKSSENQFYFFTCILPDYFVYERPKDFWKNSHFENMRAGFLLRCQIWLW